MIFNSIKRYTVLLALGLAVVTSLEWNVDLPNINNHIRKHKEMKAKNLSNKQRKRLLILVKETYFKKFFDSIVSNKYMNINFNIHNQLSTNRNINTSSENDSENNIYEVLYILNHRNRSNGRHYLIQWKKYPRMIDYTYESRSSLEKGASSILGEYENFLLENAELLRTRILVKNSPHFRRMVREHLKMGVASRSTTNVSINRPICYNTYSGNRLIVENYFNYLVENGYYSNNTAVKLRPWMFNGISIDLKMKSQLEILIWNAVYNKLKADNYCLSKHLIGCNTTYTSAKSGQKELKKKLSTIIPDIQDFSFTTKLSIKKYLLQNFLKLTIYDKPVLCLLNFPTDGYGSPYHASVAMITRINDDWELRYFDPWPKSEENTRNFVTSVLEESYDVFKSINTSRLSTFGEQTDLSCLRLSINTIADLLDGKLVSAFKWFNVFPK